MNQPQSLEKFISLLTSAFTLSPKRSSTLSDSTLLSSALKPNPVALPETHPKPGGLPAVQSQARVAASPQLRDNGRAVAQREAEAERSQHSSQRGQVQLLVLHPEAQEADRRHAPPPGRPPLGSTRGSPRRPPPWLAAELRGGRRRPRARRRPHLGCESAAA